MLKYFSCFSYRKPKMVRRDTGFPKKQSVIDIDNGTIEIESKYDNVKYEYIAHTGILHGYKK